MYSSSSSMHSYWLHMSHTIIWKPVSCVIAWFYECQCVALVSMSITVCNVLVLCLWEMGLFQRNNIATWYYQYSVLSSAGDVLIAVDDWITIKYYCTHDKPAPVSIIVYNVTAVRLTKNTELVSWCRECLVSDLQDIHLVPIAAVCQQKFVMHLDNCVFISQLEWLHCNDHSIIYMHTET